MLYPAYVEIGDEKTAWSVVIPDFPGCFSAADKAEDLIKNVKEAVALYCHDEKIEIPKASKLEDLKQSGEFDYDGVWMFFDIDLSKTATKSKKI